MHHLIPTGHSAINSSRDVQVEQGRSERSGGSARREGSDPLLQHTGTSRLSALAKRPMNVRVSSDHSHFGSSHLLKGNFFQAAHCFRVCRGFCLQLLCCLEWFPQGMYHSGCSRRMVDGHSWAATSFTEVGEGGEEDGPQVVSRSSESPSAARSEPFTIVEEFSASARWWAASLAGSRPSSVRVLTNPLRPTSPSPRESRLMQTSPQDPTSRLPE